MVSLERIKRLKESRKTEQEFERLKTGATRVEPISTPAPSGGMADFRKLDQESVAEAKQAAEQAQSEQTQALGTIIVPIDPSIEQARQAAEQLKKQWDNRYKLHRLAAAKAAEPQKTPSQTSDWVSQEAKEYAELPWYKKIGKALTGYVPPKEYLDKVDSQA